MKHGPVERALGAVLTLFAAHGAAHAAASAPAAPVVHAAPQSTLPLNDILRGEWDISLGTLADGSAYEPRIPYVNVYNSPTVSPTYAGHLRHGEDPRNGVTVSAVLTDPAGGQHTYPCWYGEDMAVDTATPTWDISANALVHPTGYAGWHLTYPCKTPGAWTGHLTVTDAGGTATGPTFSFTVAGALTFPDAAKGRLSVAPDTRYLRFDDGDAWLPVGANFGFNSPESCLQLCAAARASHARMLVRHFQSRFGGSVTVTGGADYDASAGADHGMTGEDAHSGRFSYRVTSRGGELHGSAGNPQFSYYSPLGQSERFGVWVKAVGASAGSSVGITQYGSYGTGTLTTTDVNGADIHDGAWHYVQGTLGAAIVSPKQVFLTVSGSAQGYFLFDDLAIVEASHAGTLSPAVGPGSAWDLLGGVGGYELQNTLDQTGCGILGPLLDQCRQSGVEQLIEFYSCTDRVQGGIRADGTFLNPQDPQVNSVDDSSTGQGPNDQFGQYANGPSGTPSAPPYDDGTETCVGLFHAQQVRDWVARFGAYVGQGVAYIDYANETPIAGQGGQAQIGPEHWAVQMRSVTADVQPLCGADTYVNANGPQWTRNLYESPWLQFAAPHVGIGADSDLGTRYEQPFDQDNPDPFGTWYGTRHGVGGPFGMGYMEYAPGASVAAPMHLPTMRTPGTWTLSYYVQTAPDSRGQAFSAPVNTSWYIDQSPCGLTLSGPTQTVTLRNTFADHNGQAVNGLNGAGFTLFNLAPVPAGGYPAWTKVTGQFTLSGPTGGVGLNVNNGQSAGLVRYSDITITDPNGRVFWQDRFDEPLTDRGAGDSVAIYDEPFDVAWSGDAGAARPVVIGESERYGAVPHTTGTVTTTSDNYPGNTFFCRQAAAMADARYHVDTNWYEDSGVLVQGGYVPYFAAMQSLLDGFFAPDGGWREVVTAQSGFAGQGEPFAVYGQANSRDTATGALVDASKALLGVLPLQPDPNTPHAFLPGTGVVDLQGLADAPYTVQEYDAVSGHLLATLTATSAGHHLPLNFNGLATGMVVKVSPVSAPALTLQLAVDHATASPGDVVTYTLTYTNTGTGPALAVTVPWAVPAHMLFLSASGGTYDSAHNVVNWNLGTLAPGASGSVVLKARVQ